MSDRSIGSIVVRYLTGIFSVGVSLLGLFYSAIALGYSGQYFRVLVLFYGLVPAFEFPAFLMSFKFPRLAVSILWLLYLSNFMVAIGIDPQYCHIPSVCGAYDSWGDVLSIPITSPVLILTLITAVLAQAEYLMRRSSSGEGIR